MLSSAGIGSGLDVENIVTQLMAIERRPIDLLNQQTSRVETQLSSFGQLQGALSNLRDKARALTGNDAFASTVGNSADASAVAISTGIGSVPGSYSVSVSQLAGAQTLASGTFADSTATVGGGTLTIELGAYGAGGGAPFTPKADATPVAVVIDAADSLATIRDKINSAGAGVVASIVNDATGARLTLRSRETGQANAFRVTVADDDGGNTDATGLSALGYDAAAGGGALTRTQTAADALATINGLDIVSSSNTLTDVIDGLTLKLGKVTTGAIDLTVTPNDEAIKKAITDFATAYNDLVKLGREQTKFTEGGGGSGPLQGDRTAVGMLQRLRSLIGGNTAASTVFTRLADVGLEPQSDGTLSVKTTKLDSAVANLPELKKVFGNVDDAVPANNGFAQVLRLYADEVLGAEGALTTKQEGLRQRIDRNGDREAELENRMTLIERRLRAQYTALDAQMARLTGLSDFVTRQLSALSLNNNSN